MLHRDILKIQKYVRYRTHQRKLHQTLTTFQPNKDLYKTFRNILGGISKYRVQNLCRNNLNPGLPPIENRGGDRRSKKFGNYKKLVMEFIRKLEPVVCH